MGGLLDDGAQRARGSVYVLLLGPQAWIVAESSSTLAIDIGERRLDFRRRACRETRAPRGPTRRIRECLPRRRWGRRRFAADPASRPHPHPHPHPRASARARVRRFAEASSRPAKRKTSRRTAGLTLLDLRPALPRSRSLSLSLSPSRSLTLGVAPDSCRNQCRTPANRGRAAPIPRPSHGRNGPEPFAPELSPWPLPWQDRKGTRSIASLRTSWIADAVVCAVSAVPWAVLRAVVCIRTMSRCHFRHRATIGRVAGPAGRPRPEAALCPRDGKFRFCGWTSDSAAMRLRPGTMRETSRVARRTSRVVPDRPEVSRAVAKFERASANSSRLATSTDAYFRQRSIWSLRERLVTS